MTTSQGGRPAKPIAELRTHSINIRFNLAELQEIDMLRNKITRAAFLRQVFLKTAPRPVPEINQKAYIDLARSASNLNQITKRINTNGAVDIAQLQAELREFRLKLLGVGL